MDGTVYINRMILLKCLVPCSRTATALTWDLPVALSPDGLTDLMAKRTTNSTCQQVSDERQAAVSTVSCYGETVKTLPTSTFRRVLWDNSFPLWVEWRGGGYCEGARGATRRAITTVRTSSRKGSGSLAGYAQSPRGASTGATGNGLEVNARAEQPKRTYAGAQGTWASLPLFTVGGGCQVLTLQRDALDTCPITVPAA